MLKEILKGLFFILCFVISNDGNNSNNAIIYFFNRLRQTCTEDQCGPGVRMALHHDRFYCGKCHLTIKIPKSDRNKK